MKRLLLVGLVLVAGCGTQDAGTPRTAATATPAPPLSDSERERLRRVEAQVQRHCVRVSQSLTDPAAAPTPAQEARAFAAADDLLALVRSRPRAEVVTGQDLRLYLSDVIENLEGGNCDPRMRARLERGLKTIPR
jgi:hypothetical protein